MYTVPLSIHTGSVCLQYKDVKPKMIFNKLIHFIYENKIKPIFKKNKIGLLGMPLIVNIFLFKFSLLFPLAICDHFFVVKAKM